MRCILRGWRSLGPFSLEAALRVLLQSWAAHLGRFLGQYSFGQLLKYLRYGEAEESAVDFVWESLGSLWERTVEERHDTS